MMALSGNKRDGARDVMTQSANWFAGDADNALWLCLFPIPYSSSHMIECRFLTLLLGGPVLEIKNMLCHLD